jgi:hypothetical protein
MKLSLIFALSLNILSNALKVVPGPWPMQYDAVNGWEISVRDFLGSGYFDLRDGGYAILDLTKGTEEKRVLASW